MNCEVHIPKEEGRYNGTKGWFLEGPVKVKIRKARMRLDVL